MTRKLLLVAVVALLAAPVVQAQEGAPQATKYAGDWYEVTHVRFHTGKRDEALQLIREHFAPAGTKTETGPSMVLLHHTGPWDMTLVWKLKGGPADMEWEVSPDDARWRQAMAELEGGPDKAKAVWDRYMALVADADSSLARSWSPAGGGGGAE